MARVILLPIGRTNASERAFDYCFQNIWRSNDKVLLLHVHKSHPPIMFGVEGIEGYVALWAEQMKEESREIEKLKEKYNMKCKDAEIVDFEFKVLRGSVEDKIVEIAKKKNVDMIVMGTQSLSAIRRTFLGSPSDYVIRHSDVATVIVPS